MRWPQLREIAVRSQHIVDTKCSQHIVDINTSVIKISERAALWAEFVSMTIHPNHAWERKRHPRIPACAEMTVGDGGLTESTT